MGQQSQPADKVCRERLGHVAACACKGPHIQNEIAAADLIKYKTQAYAAGPHCHRLVQVTEVDQASSGALGYRIGSKTWVSVKLWLPQLPGTSMANTALVAAWVPLAGAVKRT